MTNESLDPTAVTEPPPFVVDGRYRRFVSFLVLRYGILFPGFVVVALFGVGSAVINGFASRDNVDSILILATFLGVAASGQTLVIILGGIDLSIASGIGLGEVFTSVEYSRGMPLWQICFALAGLGIAVGFVNGWTSSYFRVHPLIVTLGVGFAISGGTLIWTSGGAAQGISPPALASIVSLGSTIGPVPVPPIVLVWLGVAIILLVIQKWSRIGREVYALGSNPIAARLALARNKTAWIFVYALSGLAAVMTGVLLAGFSGGANFTAGAPYLFDSIAAVVVGGTSLLGGTGGYGRTILGSLIIIEITTILVGFSFGSALQETLLGVLIIVLAALTGREKHVRSRV